ncbi:hypothetical protein SUDANB120_02875 [Streptomyces sp. enrichment culture]|uniref:hypothetical protein n=1 Tax=Streptomyces sp. enrichment culture TaxID=1795815 RepID=UPI003F5587B9
MSTPEEQQRRQYGQQHPEQQHQSYQQHQQPQQDPHQHQPQQQGAYGAQQPVPEADPYGTQTWQAPTWDTGYQPVQRPEPAQQQVPQQPLGGLPGQQPAPERPVAPEGWFRDEPPSAPQQPAQAADWTGNGYPQAYPAPQYPAQPAAPEGWFRDEAPAAPAPARAPAAAPGHDWADETAYLPPVQGAAAAGSPYPPPVQGAEAAAETAYLPPVRDAAAPGASFPPPVQDAAETAYLPPVRDTAVPGGPYPPPAQGADAAAETAYLPPVREGAGVPDGWYREEAPAAAGTAGAASGAESWAEATAYLPPQAAADPVEAAGQPGTPAGQPAGQPGEPQAPGEEPAYSPPTLGGNTMRAVDPAQARAEGLSPIIDPGPQSALLTAALGLLLAAAAPFGDLALLVPLVVLQGLTAAGWFRLNGMWPARQGIALAFLGALVADAAVLAVDAVHGPGAIIGTLGVWVLLTLVLQLRSAADPDERMYGLMASVASAALAIMCAGFLAAGSAAVSVGAVAVAVAVFVRALPLPPAPSVAVSLAAAAGSGVAVGALTSLGAGGALLGLAAGVCALIGLRVAAYDYPSKFVHMTAGVALPLAAAAPAVYLLGRVVG